MYPTIKIIVKGGVVCDVDNLPDGFKYEVIDHDVKESKCDCCKDSQDHETHYWNENICEIEEDYIMPDEYGCVCYRCFEDLKQEGKITFK